MNIEWKAGRFSTVKKDFPTSFFQNLQIFSLHAEHFKFSIESNLTSLSHKEFPSQPREVHNEFLIVSLKHFER